MRNLVLAVVVAALVVVLARWAVVHKAEQAELQSERQKVAALDSGAVDRLEITRRDNAVQAMRFEKRSGTWWMVLPEQYPASKYTLDSLVNGVAELKKERTFAAPSAAMGQDTYGLRVPQYEIRLYGQGLTRSVRLGEKNPAGDLWYAQTDTDDATTINLVRTGLDNQLNKSPSDFRVREIFWDFPQDVTHMRVEYHGLVTDFTRDLSSQPASQATWYFATSTLPATRPAEKMQVDAVLNGMRNLSATGFEPPKARKLDRRLTVWGSGSTASVGLAPGTDAGFVAVVDGRPFHYTVPVHSAKPLFKLAKRFEPDTSNPGALNEMLRESLQAPRQDQDEP